MTVLMTAKELMSKLDEDILITDPAYQKIIATLENYHTSFNPIKNSQQEFQLLQQINQSLYHVIEKNTDPAPQVIQTLLTSVQQRCIALANIPALQQTVPKNLHFIWLGQLGKIQQDYIKAWGETNKGQQGYRIKIWYDPNALLVYPLAKHIKDFAAKNTFIGEIDWVDKVIQLQNQAYSEITQALKNNQTFDQAALDFICRRLGGSRENLEHIMADNQASFNNFIANAGSDYILQDINTVLDQGIDKKYYYQELALRQNTAAASDLLRLQILNQQGGVYFDVDFLPQWKPDLFNTEIITEMKRLQEGNIALLQTQLVLEHLQADFPARTALAKRGQYQDYVAIFAKRSADHATLVDKMRICIRNKGNSPRDFFQALAPQRILPDGLRRAKIFFTGSNAGMVAPANSASLTTLMQYITNNYHRLEDLDLVDIQQYTDINQEKILGYAHQFKRDYGSGSDDFDATPAVNYRLDGLLPEARATISISGPGAVTQGLKKLSQRWFDSDPRVSFDQDLFEQFNGSTEEDRTHSWLTTTSSSLQGKFRRVMSRDDLLKIIPMSFIKTGYQPILMTLDKLHNTRGIEKTQTAFILKNQLRDYIAKQPDPRRNAAFSKLVDQLNNALFSADMAHFKTVINDIGATRPALANQLYLYAFNEAHGDNLGLTDAMIRAVQTDPYLHLQPKSRFSGASLPTNLADFASTYQVKLASAEDFAEFKRLLLHAQEQDQHTLNKVFLDDREKTIHLGYHYQELIDPQPNARAQQAMDYLQSAIAKIRDNQDTIWPDAEFFMLAKFGDKNYIDNLQLERLADIKAIYQADHAWEKPLVIKINNGGSSHYQSQIIIQLEDDRYCVNAAASLASKHSNSVFVQLNNKGDYRVVYGDPTQLSGKIRWQLVGHGGGSFSDQHRMADAMVDTMADTTAQALAIRLTHFSRKFSAQYGVNSAANYISLVGCCLVPFAKDLAQQLDQRGIRTDIGARSTILSVAEGIGALKAGSKITQEAKSGHWHHKASQHKTVFRWNKQGQLVEKISLKARLEQTFDLMKNHLVPTQQPLQSPREPEVDMTPRIVTTHPGVRHLYQGSRYMGSLMQIQGRWGVISTLRQYKMWLDRDDLTPKQRKDLTLERNLAIAAIGVDSVTDALGDLTARLGSQRGQMGSHAGRKFLKGSPAVLAVLSSGFDIYHATDSFTRLSSEQDPDRRQDLIVNGSLSTLSATVGISSGVAFSVGGRIAAAAGSVGLAVNMAIFGLSQTYNTVRTLQETEKYTRLSIGETLDNYVQLFMGAPLRPEVENRVEKEKFRQHYDRLLDQQAEKEIADILPQGIHTLYYSRGDFDLQERPYRYLFLYQVTGYKIVRGQKRRKMLPRGGEDKIRPEEINQVKKKYAAKYPLFELYFSEVDSQYHYFTPINLRDVDDFIDANQPQNGLTPNVRKKERPQSDEMEIETKDNAILFNLGGGNDTAIGDKNKKNIFQVGLGRKNYQGGQLANVFYLEGKEAPTEPSTLKGGLDNNDSIVASRKPVIGSGYDIDLNQGTVRYRGQTALVATINHIEHAIGHAESDDILTGNQHNNYLDGRGGDDRLYGGEGDDILVLTRGYADGGRGIDSYHILQNTQTSASVIAIDESLSLDESTPEASNIMLEYHLDQILSIQLIQTNTENNRYGIEILLRNDNASETRLKLMDIYQASADTPDQLTLAKQAIFSTRDGMLLFPQWPKIIKRNDDDNHWPFLPHFNAQYSTLHDRRSSSIDFFKNLPADYSIHLQQHNGDEPGAITLGNSKIVLPEFMSLIAEDTPFNDHILGNSLDNQLYSRRGDDTLMGGAGADIYHIYHEKDAVRKICIDNQDAQASPQLDLLLLHTISLAQLNQIYQEGDDIILAGTNLDANIGDVVIHISHFMRDAGYRHIVIMDKLGDFYQLDIDEEGDPYLGQISADQKIPTNKAEKHEMNGENIDKLIAGMSSFLATETNEVNSGGTKSITHSTNEHLFTAQQN